MNYKDVKLLAETYNEISNRPVVGAAPKNIDNEVDPVQIANDISRNAILIARYISNRVQNQKQNIFYQNEDFARELDVINNQVKRLLQTVDTTSYEPRQPMREIGRK